jgi:hypothetical protein
MSRVIDVVIRFVCVQVSFQSGQVLSMRMESTVSIKAMLNCCISLEISCLFDYDIP